MRENPNPQAPDPKKLDALAKPLTDDKLDALAAEVVRARVEAPQIEEDAVKYQQNTLKRIEFAVQAMSKRIDGEKGLRTRMGTAGFEGQQEKDLERIFNTLTESATDEVGGRANAKAKYILVEGSKEGSRYKLNATAVLNDIKLLKGLLALTAPKDAAKRSVLEDTIAALEEYAHIVDTPGAESSGITSRASRALAREMTLDGIRNRESADKRIGRDLKPAAALVLAAAAVILGAIAIKNKKSLIGALIPAGLLLILVKPDLFSGKLKVAGKEASATVQPTPGSVFENLMNEYGISGDQWAEIAEMLMPGNIAKQAKSTNTYVNKNFVQMRGTYPQIFLQWVMKKDATLPENLPGDIAKSFEEMRDVVDELAPPNNNTIRRNLAQMVVYGGMHTFTGQLELSKSKDAQSITIEYIRKGGRRALPAPPPDKA